MTDLKLRNLSNFRLQAGIVIFAALAPLIWAQASRQLQVEVGTNQLVSILARGVSYGEVLKALQKKLGWEIEIPPVADELQLSVYNFEAADVEKTWKHFELCEAEAKALLETYAALSKEPDHAREKIRFPLLGGYDLCLKCSHLFNVLDARGAISVTERVGIIGRVRKLAVSVAEAWVEQQFVPEEVVA